MASQRLMSGISVLKDTSVAFIFVYFSLELFDYLCFISGVSALSDGVLWLRCKAHFPGFLGVSRKKHRRETLAFGMALTMEFPSSILGDKY